MREYSKGLPRLPPPWIHGRAHELPEVSGPNAEHVHDPNMGELAGRAESVHGGRADRELPRHLRDREERLVSLSRARRCSQQQASSKFSAICC